MTRGGVKVTESTSVTEPGRAAADARQLNAALPGTLAHNAAKNLEKLLQSTYTEMIYYEDASPEDALRRYISETEGKRSTSSFAWIQCDTCRIAVLAVRDDSTGNNTCGFMLWFGVDTVRIRFYLKNFTGLHIFNITFEKEMAEDA